MSNRAVDNAQDIQLPDFWDIEHDADGGEHFENHHHDQTDWPKANVAIENTAKENAQRKEVHTASVVKKIIAAGMAGSLMIAAYRPAIRAYRSHVRRHDEDSAQIYEADEQIDIVDGATDNNQSGSANESQQGTSDTPEISILEKPGNRYSITEQEVEQIMSEPAPVHSESDLKWGEDIRRRDLNHEPTFRGATVQVVTPSSYGTGALVEVDGELYIRTINHVVDLTDYKGENYKHYAYFPGVGIVDLPEFYLAFHENIEDFKKGQDTNVLIPLRTALAQKLRDKQAEGVISPLMIADRAPSFSPDRHDYYFIANPETGHYYRLRLLDPGDHQNDNDNIHWLVIDEFGWDTMEQAEVEGKLLCSGFSGSPLIDAKGSWITHGQVATWRFEYHYHDNHGRLCSIEVGIQAN